MTQHSSLKIKGIGEGHRSVLKRFERILRLKKEEKWEDGDSVFGIPKVKNLRAKIRKEKAAAPAAAEAVAVPGAPEGAPVGTAATSGAHTAPAGKPAAGAPPAAKTEVKGKPQAAEATAKEPKKKK